MPETLRAVAPPLSASLPEMRPERRQIRRAGISIQVRVRTADANDGAFEEVKMTQSASRKAIYFLTTLDRYYKGMRVWVASSYEPSAGAANLEQIGEVARIHKRADGYGIAIALLAFVPPAGAKAHNPGLPVSSAPQRPTGAIAVSHERRGGKRSPFIAPVEIEEMRTGSHIKARTSDLSMQGCYVDTLNPLPVGSGVRMQIQRSGKILDALATVSSRHAGSGMGLVFGEFREAQRAVLESWLCEVGLPRTIIENPFPEVKKTAVTGGDCATRLVRILVRKGVLTGTEADEVLRECKADLEL